MPKREVNLLLKDIKESLDKIERYTAFMTKAEFLADEKTIDAVIRNFEIIGEAARQMPEDFILQNPSIPWRDIRDFRNVLIHEYFGVSLKTVWEILQINLPELKIQLEKLISE